MKLYYVCIFSALLACNDPATEVEPVTVPDSLNRNTDTPPAAIPQRDTQPPAAARTYQNTRFKEVTVQKLGENSFRVKGKGQIFEANFSWVVEDGHNELKKGFGMTSEGAPGWGRFNFTIEVSKASPNTTLTLILFESSAMDGSRQHELPVPLP